MLIAFLSLMQIAGQNPPPPVKPVGPPEPIAPHTMPVLHTGDGDALGAIGALDANMIEAAKLATSKASSSAVRSYAATVLKDHDAALTRATKLSNQLKITRVLPPDSAMARAHADEMTRLNLLTGADFDRAFVQCMVDDHKAALAKLHSTWIPQAVKPKVKSYMTGRLPELTAHERDAEKWLAEHP